MKQKANTIHALTIWLALQIIIISCAFSPKEIAIQTQAAETVITASWTATPTSTLTPTITPSATPTLTLTPTITPTPSPTPFAGGGKIAFQVWDSSENDNLYLMNPDGSNLKKVFDTSQLELDFNWDSTGTFTSAKTIAWSPDRKFLIAQFNSKLPTLPHQEVLIIYNLSESSFGQIGPFRTHFQKFGWSPTSTRYFYSRSKHFDKYFDGYITKVFGNADFLTDTIYNKSSGFDLAYGMQSENQLLFLIDDTQEILHFYKFDIENRSKEIVSPEFPSDYLTIQVDGKNLGGGSDPIISPNMSSAYIHDCEPSPNRYDCMLYRLGFDGSKMQTVLSLKGELIETAEISPDNQRLVYSHCFIETKNLFTRKCNVSYLELQTNEIIPVSENISGYTANDPTWSPDGKYILYLYSNLNAYGSSFKLYSILDSMTVDIPINLELPFVIHGSPDW